MKSGQKVAVSLLIAVVVFSAFTVIAFSGLFELIETRFYNQRITENLQKELENASQVIGEFNEKNLQSFSTLLSRDYIKRTYLPNQSSEDITERQQRFNYLQEELDGFLFVRFIDPRGRIHYSTLESDILEQKDFSITYKRFEEVIEERSLDAYLVNTAGAQKILIQEEQNLLIYALPVYDTLDIYKGTALFYSSVKALRNNLMNNNILLPGENFGIIEDKGFVINFPDSIGRETRTDIRENWQSTGEFEDKINLVESEGGRRYVLLTTVTDNQIWIGNIVDSQAFTLNTYLRIILLASFFIAFFMILFLIFSFKQDKVVVLSERIKRFQINFLKEYVEKSEHIDRDLWRRDLASKKGIISKEIKRGIGNLKPGQEEEVDNLIDRSWDEILNLVGSRISEDRTEGVSSENAVKLENLEKALEKVLQSGALVVKTTGTAEVQGGTSKESSAAESASGQPVPVEDTAENLEEIEETEGMEYLEEVEAVEEVEFVEEAEAAENAVQPEEAYPGEKPGEIHTAENEGPDESAELTEELPGPGESIEIEELGADDEYDAEELREADAVEYVEEETAAAEAEEEYELLEELPEVESTEEDLETEEGAEIEKEPEKGKAHMTSETSEEERKEMYVLDYDELDDFEEAEAEDVEEIPEVRPEEVEEAEEALPDKPEEIEEAPETEEEPHPEEIEEIEEYEDTERPVEVEPAEENIEEIEDVEEIEEEYDEVEELQPIKELHAMKQLAIKAEENLEELETLELTDENEEVALERIAGGYSFFGSYNDGFKGMGGTSDWKGGPQEEVSEVEDLEDLEDIDEPEELGESQEKVSASVLISRGFIEVIQMDTILKKIANHVDTVEVQEGVFTVPDRFVKTPAKIIKDRELKTLADEVLHQGGAAGKDTEEGSETLRERKSETQDTAAGSATGNQKGSSIGELFAFSDVDLPVHFAESGPLDEEEDAPDDSKVLCLQPEGFNIDVFIREKEVSRHAGPIKSLLYLSRHFGALFGAVMMRNGNTMTPELTIGLDGESTEDLTLNPEQDLVRLVVQEKNCAWVKVAKLDNGEYKPNVSGNDRRYLSSTFLVPSIFEGKNAVLLLGLKNDTIGLNRLVDQLIAIR